MITLEKTLEGVKTFSFGLHPMFGGKLDVGAQKMISGEATHCLVSALDGKRMQFGIGILTK